MASSKIFATVLLVMAMAAAASAATYTVGDSTGWIIPATSSFYDTWAASKTFRVNDKLVFNFPTGMHTAVRVSENEYKACTFANPLETYGTGPATVTLKDAGTHYYLCSIPGHCAAGQKVTITVVSAASSPPPSKAPSAPSPSPAARPPSPVATPPASSSPPSVASPAPSPVVRPPTPLATPPASSPSSTASPAPSPVVRPPTPFATPPAPFSVPPASSPSPSPSSPPSLASPPPPPPGSPSPSAATPPPPAGTPGTSPTPPVSAASFNGGFTLTTSTFVALVLAFTFV